MLWQSWLIIFVPSICYNSIKKKKRRRRRKQNHQKPWNTSPPKESFPKRATTMEASRWAPSITRGHWVVSGAWCSWRTWPRLVSEEVFTGLKSPALMGTEAQRSAMSLWVWSKCGKQISNYTAIYMPWFQWNSPSLSGYTHLHRYSVTIACKALKILSLRSAKLLLPLLSKDPPGMAPKNPWGCPQPLPALTAPSVKPIWGSGQPRFWVVLRSSELLQGIITFLLLFCFLPNSAD